MRRVVAILTFVFLLASAFGVLAEGDRGSKDEATAMVKKAVEHIKADGQEKAFADFSDLKGQFVDRDLYIVVYDMTGKCLAHGANPKIA